MEIEEVMLEVVDALSSQHISYLLVGSFSSNFYGIPRSTRDVDFVIEIGQQSIHTFTKHLSTRFTVQSQIAFESVTGTTRHIIDVAGTPFHVELFRISNDAHDRERFARRVQVSWLERNIWLPTAEDVIITKLRWLSHLARNKDYDDVLQVASVQKGHLDWGYIEGWAREHGTLAIVEQIRSEVPDL